MRNNTFRDGKVHVMADKCPTCIFRPGNLMHLNRGRVKDMVGTATSDQAGSITCHSTLDTDKQAVCRGFYDRHATPVLQLAEAMGVVEFQDA
jgi:hypothetical protein